MHGKWKNLFLQKYFRLFGNLIAHKNDTFQFFFEKMSQRIFIPQVITFKPIDIFFFGKKVHKCAFN